MAAAAKATFPLYVPISIFLFLSTRSSKILLFWFLSHLSREVVNKVLQEPPGDFLLPCLFSLQQVSGWLEPPRGQGLVSVRLLPALRSARSVTGHLPGQVTHRRHPLQSHPTNLVCPHVERGWSLEF